MSLYNLIKKTTQCCVRNVKLYISSACLSVPLLYLLFVYAISLHLTLSKFCYDPYRSCEMLCVNYMQQMKKVA
jgi:hypothetical protein